MEKVLNMSEPGGVLMAALRTPAPLLFGRRDVEPRDRDPAVPVMVSIILLKNTEGAFPAGDINALARLVIENVIGCHVNDSGTLHQSRGITPSTRPCLQGNPLGCPRNRFSTSSPDHELVVTSGHESVQCVQSQGLRSPEHQSEDD